MVPQKDSDQFLQALETVSIIVQMPVTCLINYFHKFKHDLLPRFRMIFPQLLSRQLSIEKLSPTAKTPLDW